MTHTRQEAPTICDFCKREIPQGSSAHDVEEWEAIDLNTGEPVKRVCDSCFNWHYRPSWRSGQN